MLLLLCLPHAEQMHHWTQMCPLCSLSCSPPHAGVYPEHTQHCTQGIQPEGGIQRTRDWPMVQQARPRGVWLPGFEHQVFKVLGYLLPSQLSSAWHGPRASSCTPDEGLFRITAHRGCKVGRKGWPNPAPSWPSDPLSWNQSNDGCLGCFIISQHCYKAHI